MTIVYLNTRYTSVSEGLVACSVFFGHKALVKCGFFVNMTSTGKVFVTLRISCIKVGSWYCLRGWVKGNLIAEEAQQDFKLLQLAQAVARKGVECADGCC